MEVDKVMDESNAYLLSLIPMDWQTQPQIYCKTPEDRYLYDLLMAIINAPSNDARKSAHNQLFKALDRCHWLHRIRACAKYDRCFAEALDNFWPWLFGKNQEGLHRIAAFKPRSAQHGLTNSFFAYLKNKFEYLLKTVYTSRNKPMPSSLDSLLELNFNHPVIIDPGITPLEQVLETEDNAETRAFLTYCAQQPSSLDVTYGQQRTQSKGLTCNAYLQKTYFSSLPLTQKQLAQEFSLSLDTVNDLVKQFRLLLKQEYIKFINNHRA
jgi:hypothetical protein